MSNSHCTLDAPGAEEETMNGMSFSKLCCLFCCPPCPSTITAKVAFRPPVPTYNFVPVNEKEEKYTINFTEGAEWQFGDAEKECLDAFYTRTSRGSKIACMYVKCCPNAKYTVLFSHANAVDLGMISSFYVMLGMRINCNIFSFDYSGYGSSSGKPLEKNLYPDVNAAWLALQKRYSISPENVILYGQSIGTVPTIDLAARNHFAGVILHSPLMSGMRVLFETRRTWCFDVFTSIEKVHKIQSPVLVIHGTEDEVINFSHGVAIYEKCSQPVEPLWVEGANHNDIEVFPQYLERLRHFINSDLSN